MRALSCVAIGVFLTLAALCAQPGQDANSEEEPQDQFFTGTITELTETSVKVTRTVLGQESAERTFAIAPETHIEGKPKVKSRVTVRYVTDESGDKAVRIIVRGAAPPPKKP